jgi:HTH-type transcriptional regulator/antitoxin HigA
MALATIDPVRYAELLGKTLPKVIETEAEYERFLETLEELDFAKRELSPEEDALSGLLARLIEEYEERRFPVPDAPPHEVLRFLMDQRGLRQADLVPVVGSSAQVSDMVSGNRGISKAMAKRLAQFFHVTPDLFI